MLAAVAALALAAATPPAWFAGAELLALVGLGAWYAVATRSRRPALWCFVLGAVHMAWFSWSLRHEFWVGLLLVALIGGGYYALAVPWTRALRRLRVPGPIAFGTAVAGTFWLRAVMPGLHYPHGQPVHDFYRWPQLLGLLQWGGEGLANLWLAAAAAALVGAWRGWREARPPWRRARVVFLVVWGLGAAATLLPPPRATASEPAARVSILAIEPDLPVAWLLDPGGNRLIEERLIAPTLRRAGARAPAPPDLVLWPETALPIQVDATGRGDPRLAQRWRPPLARATRLVAGTTARFPGDRHTPVAVVLDAMGRVVGLQEKQRLVPAGEFIPFTGLLPTPVRRGLLDGITSVMGAAPDFLPGSPRPLPTTAAGTPFGALLCYDNCFPEVARGMVEAGARFLVVLSNEAWYHRGSELEQMVAMTVCRALENGTPLVRCTIDGPSVAIDARGRVVHQLSWQGPKGAESRFLLMDVDPGPGRRPPMAWLHEAFTLLIALSGLALAWPRVARWARLLRALPSPERRGPPGSVP